ncbi:HD-GYP domain-containing protein [Arcobacter aquimarinus]|uniref:Two-component system response regulator c-di-GMP phosphodiesterase, RpfG family n=1 Tax=Arcobacter aquimarinus TaxID=1315211 RepID=A0AAE7E2C1_9BACT|nr:HD domain-containing phosphohydrolase [Arcobacter aquimarinus]QKE26471.1 two-component system response regulator c-di-GMP phosphodiesterase, RpfG family [Arcobacter aquimarinus]RXI33394.1 two-component system response regulator [Arcobacter aquimarinus]
MNFKSMKIVSIDDNENNLFLIESICTEMELQVRSFSEPLEALMYVLQNQVDMILIDYMMPNLNGLEFIEEYRKKIKNVPIIMITAAGDDENIHKRAFELGANDFLSKPVNFVIFKARTINLLTNYQNQILLEDKAKLLEKEVEKATENLLKREHETLTILGKTAEYKDPETASHVARVAYYSKLLAKGYGLSEKEQDILFYSAPFHDLGKIGIEDKILLKPSKLTNEEFETMKKHPKIGYEILKNSQSEYLQAGAIIALTHHEKINGSGYPNGLKGDDIHIFGRIVAIADVFDALTSFRPYKQAWSFEDAVNYLQEKSGKEFDTKLVEIFINNIDEVTVIYNSFKDE